MKLHTFCHWNWPGKQIWTRDIDKCADLSLLNSIANKTGTALPAAKNTLLSSYQSFVFERLIINGNSKWVRPIGVYHRTRRQFGLRWCPHCLSSDQKPYFRKKWRMSFASTCPSHGVILKDHCNDCAAPCIPHKSGFLNCHQCGADISKQKTIIADSQVLQADYLLCKLAEDGVYDLARTGFSHSILYFDTWYRILSLVAFGTRSQALRDLTASIYDGDPSPISEKYKLRSIDALSTIDLHKTSTIATRLMQGFPFRLIGLCAETRNWSTQVLKDMRPMRFTLYEASKNYLAGPIT